MPKNNLSKLKKSPLGFIKRGIYKTVIGPFKYGQKNDYDAEKYWQDRFKKYGLSLRGAGDEGLSQQENNKMYKKAANIFIDLCRKEKIDFRAAKILDIGCGTGFYTRLFKELDVKSYTGVDITDVFFDKFKNEFPQYQFIKKDIASDKIKGKFDLIIMMDVIEHIVKESKLNSAMDNIKRCLAPNGLFFVSAIMGKSKKQNFYLRFWSLKDIQERFSGYGFRGLVPFRDSRLLVIKKINRS